MRYQTRAVLSLLAAVAALTSGCKQQSREEAEPTPAATPTAVPAPPPPATAAEPAAGASVDIPPPVQPNVPAAAPAATGSAATKKAAPESLKTCCAALRKEATTAVDKAALYNTAATSCDAIDKLVAAGTTKKSAALTTLRAGLKGRKLPAGCE